MDISDDELRSKSCLVSRWMCSLYPRNRAVTSMLRNVSLVKDWLLSCTLKRRVLTAGSDAEGTMSTDNDIDRMYIEPFVLVVHKHKEMIESRSNVLILNKSKSNPGYARLQYLGQNLVKRSCPLRKYFEKFFERTGDGIFLSSEKLVKGVLDNMLKIGKFERHGPCLSKASIAFNTLR